MSESIVTPALTRKDFQTDQEVRWCPGCGDYAILTAVQSVFPELGIPKERFVVVSGIGCSSRFPYYMNTYGFHTIHGRARDLQARGDGGSAAMDRVEAVRVHVVREARRTADSRHHHEPLLRNPQLREDRLHGGQDRVVAAARTPADLLVRLEILACQRGSDYRLTH